MWRDCYFFENLILVIIVVLDYMYWKGSYDRYSDVFMVDINDFYILFLD